MPSFYNRINTIYQFIKPFLDNKNLFLRNLEPLRRKTKTLLRLCGYAGQSESSLGAHVRMFVFLSCASFVTKIPGSCCSNSLTVVTKVFSNTLIVLLQKLQQKISVHLPC